MFRKVVVYTGGLIALYILVANTTGTGTLITDSTKGATGVISTLQGRSTS